MRFEELVRRAAGWGPYPYQAELAEAGLPDVLAVPTGAGKTLAATLPWLYRRRFHPDPEVRAATPRWLVLTLPMRVLVEQTVATVRMWLGELDDLLADGGSVDVFEVMGGEGRQEARWRYAPERDAIFVGTLDMLLSRVLNRGYGESRWAWPVDFGLFNAGCQWVFDEVQLMGPGLVTSRQLEGLRRILGTAGDCRSMWMSATISRADLLTVDNAELGRVVELTDADRRGPLAARLDAAKTIRELTGLGTRKAYLADLATAVVEKHREHKRGTRTIVVINTVDGAVGLYRELRRRLGKDAAGDVPCVLVHSRFRPRDRHRAVDRALADVDTAGPGRIVVTTQVLEAGVDVSATTLVTELAPWPSIVQRAGRCNRYGSDDGAALWWVRPPKALPYEQADLDVAANALVALEGGPASPSVLDALDVPGEQALHPVLRRRDLVELFDTLPDLSGNDVDVARFIRDVDDIDVQVAWRALPRRDEPPLGPSDPLPPRDERCPVPLASLRDELRKPGDARRAWRHDHLTGQWARCYAGDLRPGQVLILDAGQGGYDLELGWSPGSSTPVPILGHDDEVAPAPAAAVVDGTDGDTALGGDPVSYTRNRQWVGLARHLADVEREVRRLADALAPSVPPQMIEAAVVAGRYHDLGKAHEVFQSTLYRSAADDDERAVAADEPAPLAKSGGSLRPRHERPHFRHELASALALLGNASAVLRDIAEPDLAVYLVAAHHGRVRLGFRSLPGEKQPDEADRPYALGVWQGDKLPAVELADEIVPACELDLSSMQLGRSDEDAPSWAERALRLRDRADLGPFRLGFLEALVRVADWVVSAGYDDEPGGRSRG
jgi:CRISPR-associated endonuclease/helicase Cas3